MQKTPELILRTISHPHLNPDLSHWEKSSISNKERALSISSFTTKPALMQFHFRKIHEIELKTIADFGQKKPHAEKSCTLI
jgi:hypothetical protein